MAVDIRTRENLLRFIYVFLFNVAKQLIIINMIKRVCEFRQ